MKVIKGNLIDLALQGKFDVIAHGCNCFCAQKSGIASALNNVFRTGASVLYSLEDISQRGNHLKLGKIQERIFKLPFDIPHLGVMYPNPERTEFSIANCYTQYGAGTDKVYLDYSALESCMCSLKEKFSGKSLGLPKIGCGLAGGDWILVSEMLERIFEGEDLTIVEL